MPPKRDKKQYQRLDPIQHCLRRADMYVGSLRPKRTLEYVASTTEDGFSIVQEEISFAPALLRIFIEALSNAVDNVERSREAGIPCTRIKVTLDRETGETSIWNDGYVVPIDIHPEENCYIHSMIFGQLLTGSNYDDEEERIIAGRNGIGIKAVSIFSNEFQVEGVDPSVGKIFKQKWTQNMQKTSEPSVKASSRKTGYTKVTWIPDFKRFGITRYSLDIIKLYTRHVIDAAMLSGVSVSLNGSDVPVKNLNHYAALYPSLTEERLLIQSESAKVLVMPNNGQTPGGECISFVNGMYTKLGGQHVDAWSEALFRPIVTKFNSRGGAKGAKSNQKININDVKQFFRLFVLVTVVRPEFNGQNKEQLESPSIEAQVKRTQINTICKWSVMERIEDIIRAKEMVILKKIEKKKKVIVPGLDAANNAGGKHATQCSLFVCEGLSAKTYIVAGIGGELYGKSGRDWFGILPVTGKLLNVRNATPTVIAANKVIVGLIQALGLTQGLDYRQDKNFKTLNYGKLILTCDADCDGLHIEALVMNVIHALFPTLLERSEPFIISMKTPIARVFRPRKKDLLFYDEHRFNQYLTESKGKVSAKYYKGLGTTRAEDVPDTFGKKLVEYSNDPSLSDTMNKVFHKSHTDPRKEWIGAYNPSKVDWSLDDQDMISSMHISEFLDKELIKFSHTDCGRSIASMVDGLKESQRKILYAVCKRKLHYSGKSLKVAQLSGYTAEHSNYHHGEQNLQDTIIGMASDFVGSNNIPLLYPDGGFGSRLAGGADAASARYIYTKKAALTDLIFRSEDEPLLEQVNDDGDLVQPVFYMPIIPMILVNGSLGIGTGWSSTIPNFNPIEIIEATRTWIEHGGETTLEDPDSGETIELFSELQPWYRGFTGNIERESATRYITHGVLNRTKTNSVEITELPIGLWTNKFKEMCETLVVDKKLKSLKNYSTTDKVNIQLTETKDGLKCNATNLKLSNSLSLNNMVLFTEQEQIKKYKSALEILCDFCVLRLEFYVKRKTYQLKMLEAELRHLENKLRFTQGVIDRSINIMDEDEDSLILLLDQQKFDRDPSDQTFNYLLRLPIRSLTTNKMKELKNVIDKLIAQIKKLRKTTPQNIWLAELDQLESAYTKWIN
jgi:DNA topoisomerase-2